MGLLDGIFGGGRGGGDDPYADILTPAQRNQQLTQGLLAMAGAFAQAGMPSRIGPVPIGSAIGSAAAALGAGQESGLKTALENALAAQKVRDLRSTGEFRKKFFGDQDSIADALRQIFGGGTAAPAGPAGARPSSGGGAPPAGTYAGAGSDGGLLGPDLSLGSDYASGLTPDGPAATSRFNTGLLSYPSDSGGMRAGGGALAPSPDAGLGTVAPTSDYKPGGILYPFKDLGVVPGGAGGAGAAPAAERAATPVPEITNVPGGTNGIDPRKRAALDAILTGMQTAQGGPSAQLLAQFAGPGAADAPVAEGGGLLGAAPDLRAPVEADPFARRPSAGDPRGVAPVIRQAFLRQGIDPGVPLRVAASEGLATFLGDKGKSGGAFQLYTGGGLGNEFQNQTGLDPLDPANEAATIDWVAKNVNRTGWSPYHGAAKVGVGPRTGLPGGDLPPDEVIPSGPGVGGARPPVSPAQYAGGGGGGGGAAGMPQVPVPPGVDPAKMNALLLELARRNAAAEVLGMGNPYGSLLGVLQGTPQYKAAVEAATETARRGAGLPFVQPEAREKALGGYEVDIATRTYQAALDRATTQLKTEGEAANTIQEGGILVHDGKGGTQRVQATRKQAIMAVNGLAVPELGIPGLVRPPPGGVPAAGSPAGQPVLTPSQQELEKSDIKLLDQKRAIADTARTTIENANDLRRAIEQGVIAGAGADTRTQLLKLGQLLNITGRDTNELVANTEKYIASQGKNLKEGLSGLGPPISKSDTDIAERISGGQMTTPQGMLEILRIREKYHRQAIVDYNRMASGLPPSKIIGERTIKEPPTFGAQTATGPNGERIWNKDGAWVPY